MISRLSRLNGVVNRLLGRRGPPAREAQAPAAEHWPDIERPEYPRSYMLDVGNLCNLRCPFCQTGKNDTRIERGFLTRENFETIFRKIAPHARFISLMNWGEPFLNKDILYFFSRCRDSGIRTHIDSNLSVKLWTDEEAEQIVASGIGAILASIDGTTQEAYAKYRVKGNLEMALHNLRALKAARDRQKRDKPFLGWSFYLNKFNQDQVGEARRMAAEIGVPIWFKLLSCEDPAWYSKYQFAPDDPILAAPEWFKEIYPDWRPDTLAAQPLNSKLPGVCTQPFGYMIIDWNGDVYPCCVVSGPQYRLGNLILQELDEVWFGGEYVKCRSYLRNYGAKQDSGSVCQDKCHVVAEKYLPVEPASTMGISTDEPAKEVKWPDVERPRLPQLYMLDTGNVCNLRCPFCQTGKNEANVERGFLTRENFEIILHKIAPHAKFISMVNWGEPFLNKDVLYFASRCNSMGIKAHIDSNLNARRWSEKEAEEIVTSGLNSILASIDGTTQETFSKYRVRGQYEMALHNLRLLRLARDRLRLKKPFLGWAFYVNKFNEHQVSAARAIAKDIGVDIWFKLLSCEDPSWRSTYHFTANDPVLEVPKWVFDIYPDWRTPSIVQNPLHPSLPGVCVLPFGLMVINWNGDVHPCDVVWGDAFKLGNLLAQDLDEIWFGESYVKCRAFLRNYGPPQDSGSACQNHACPVAQKWLGAGSFLDRSTSWRKQ